MLQLYKNSFKNAKNGDNFNISSIVCDSFIQMLPNETFTQTTNLAENIAFGGNLKVELIDFCGDFVADITEKFYYNQFTDEKGIKQLNYEFGEIGIDFSTNQLFLKLIHTQSNDIWYSSGFHITEYQSHLTERFDYQNATDSYTQSVRLKIFRNDIETKSEVKTYTQTSGNIISLKPTLTEITKLKMDICDNFIYNKLVEILNKDLVYLNGYKISDKPQIKKGERVGGSNIFILDFECNLTKIFKKIDYQIFKKWRLSPITPTGNFSLNSSIPNLSCSFNKTTILGIGRIKIYNFSNIIVQSFNQSEMTLTNNILTVNTATIQVLPIDNYYINVDAGLFLNETKTLEINNKTDWFFNIIEADFDNNDFDSNDFLT